MRVNPSPQWYRLRSPYNEKTCPGIILMNIQYVWESNTERFPKQRGVEGPYQIYAQILSGFEIAPTQSPDALNTKIEIKIGNVSNNKGLSTKGSDGRYPKWNELIDNNIVLDKNLQFAPDMRVILFNSSKTLITRRQDWEVIGEFSVPVKSISGKLYNRPQFFNLLNNEGHLQGQVLARFFLKEVDQKKKNTDDAEGLKREFNSIVTTTRKVNIDISLFGIRNMIKNARRPVVTMKLTHSGGPPQVIKLEDSINSRSPNFGRFITFQGVELTNEPLLWPQLEV